MKRIDKNHWKNQIKLNENQDIKKGRKLKGTFVNVSFSFHTSQKEEEWQRNESWEEFWKKKR